MGAWGYDHFDSDSALDWIGFKIERPIVRAIEHEIIHFLKRKVRPIEVRVLDPEKKKEYEVWSKRNRPRRLRRPRKFRYSPEAKSWMKEWRSFQKTVKRPGRSRGHHEAEAAVALLDQLTPYRNSYYLFVWTKKFKGFRGLLGGRRKRVTAKTPGAKQRRGDSPVDVSLHYAAEQRRLYTLAARAVQALIDDECWIGSWRNPEGKRKSLLVLLGSLLKKRRNETTNKERAALASLGLRRRGRSRKLTSTRS